MKGRLVVGIILLLFLLLAGAFSLMELSGTEDAQRAANNAVPPALDYLAENYNATIGLIPATPHGDTYYLYSDNFLASLALQAHDSGNATLAEMASNISESVQEYLKPVPDAVNQYMVMTRCVGFINGSEDYVVSHIDGSTILTTQNNQSYVLAPSDYADIALVVALYDHCSGQDGDALAAYHQATLLYHGTGFLDAPFTNGPEKGQYQTYKLAFYIYVSEVLGYQYPASMQSNLLRMQAPSGGFYTGYYGNFSTGTTRTSTETTSLAILALGYPRGISIQEIAYLASIPIIMVAAAIVILKTISAGARQPPTAEPRSSSAEAQ